MRMVCLLGALMTIAPPLFAQSLYLNEGERAIEAGVAWSVGPSSNGPSLLSVSAPRVESIWA